MLVGDTSTWWAARVDHPVVPLWCVRDESGAVVAIDVGARWQSVSRFAERHRAKVNVDLDGAQSSRDEVRQLREYLLGKRRVLTFPIRMLGTPFQRRAWEALCRIPYGQTCTYAEQAGIMSLPPRLARAVGQANGRNPLAIVVPCHRVVGQDGTLTGYGGGLPAKRWLLALEDPQRELLGVAGSDGRPQDGGA